MKLNVSSGHRDVGGFYCSIDFSEVLAHFVNGAGETLVEGHLSGKISRSDPAESILFHLRTDTAPGDILAGRAMLSGLLVAGTSMRPLAVELTLGESNMAIGHHIKHGFNLRVKQSSLDWWEVVDAVLGDAPGVQMLGMFQGMGA